MDRGDKPRWFFILVCLLSSMAQHEICFRIQSPHSLGARNISFIMEVVKSITNYLIVIVKRWSLAFISSQQSRSVLALYQYSVL